MGGIEPYSCPSRNDMYDSNKSLLLIFRQKNKEQRENVIGELVTTEREYCRDLKLTWQAFSLETPEVLEQKQIDVKGIFYTFSKGLL